MARKETLTVMCASKTATFEAERQAFYDNEQHLKSRIQSLTQARKQPPTPRSPTVPDISETDTEEEEELVQPTISFQEKDPDAEPAEMTALRRELSTLSTSYASLQNTLVLLQTQLVDLKRVNNQLQEENESYNILLREKTLSGQYDLFKQVNGDESSFDDEDDQTDSMGDVQSINSGAHSSPLGTLDEHPDEEALHARFGIDHIDRDELMQHPEDEGSIGRDGSARGKRSRHGRGHHSGSSHSPPPRGESLAGLPITGPGLDLAAELGRAENKDMLEGQADDVSGPLKDKRGKTDSRKISGADAGTAPYSSHNEVDTLRNEIKSLKDANKALSLYASKIIDRIIAQEGFEHVLAVDYETKAPETPTPAETIISPDTPAEIDKKPKRRNTLFSRSNTNHPPRAEKLTTFASPPPSNPPPNRRSLSFDWRSFSPFVSGDKDKKQEANPNLRPLTLRPGSVSGARKLETHEDEEDRRERERLNATMKLMGIEKPPVSPQIQNSYLTPETAMPVEKAEGVTSPSLVSRLSIFRRATAPPDEATSSPATESQGSTANLTQDTLVQAQAEESLAALDAQERILGSEMAKGASGGFTEILPHRKSGSRRSHTSGGGSGSTIWSAGMSRAGEDD